jgi:hypothetical protein
LQQMFAHGWTDSLSSNTSQMDPSKLRGTFWLEHTLPWRSAYLCGSKRVGGRRWETGERWRMQIKIQLEGLKV